MEEETARSELGLSLIKQLASCEKGSRDRAISQLMDTWLPSQPEVSDELMRKLWKGLFYAFWHSDKFPAQSELADKLSSSFVDLDPAVSIQFLSVFFLTMRREWSGIDVFRLDKYYLLIRRFVNSMFVSLRKNSWDLDLTRRYVGVLEESVFFAEDKLRGHGVSYHVASVFLDELFAFLPVRPEAVEVLFDPFLSMLGRLSDKVLLFKIKSNVFDALAQRGKAFLGNKSEPRVASVILSMGLAKRLYELGSSAECAQGNRRTIFALHEDFSKLEKDLASSGVEEEEEIPELVPIPIEALKKCCNNGVSKKKKKKKKKKVESLEEKEAEEEEEAVKLDESAISNLQSQFEKIAAEAGLSEEVPSSCESPTKTVMVSKKRKRSEKKKDKNSSEETEAKKEKKKVKFSMKSNLIWKGQSPMPPHSLRLPPSATPRGSALKKGVPAGPVRDALTQQAKRASKPMRAKRARKAVKRLKKKTITP